MERLRRKKDKGEIMQSHYNLKNKTIKNKSYLDLCDFMPYVSDCLWKPEWTSDLLELELQELPVIVRHLTLAWELNLEFSPTFYLVLPCFYYFLRS